MMNFLMILMVPVFGVWIPGAKWAHSAAHVIGNLLPYSVDINQSVIEIYSLRVSATTSICETAGVNTFKVDQLLKLKDRMLSFAYSISSKRVFNFLSYNAARAEMVESVRDAQASVYRLLKTLKLMPYKYLEKKAVDAEPDRCVLVADVAAQWNKALADLIGLATFHTTSAYWPKEQQDQQILYKKMNDIINGGSSNQMSSQMTRTDYQNNVFDPAVRSAAKKLFNDVEKCLTLVVRDLDGWRTEKTRKELIVRFTKTDKGQFFKVKLDESVPPDQSSPIEPQSDRQPFYRVKQIIETIRTECKNSESSSSLKQLMDIKASLHLGEQECFARLGFSGKVMAAHYSITLAFEALDDLAGAKNEINLKKALRMVYLAELNSMTLVGYFVYEPYSSFNYYYSSYRAARVLEREILYRRLLSLRKQIVEVLLFDGAQVPQPNVLASTSVEDIMTDSGDAPKNNNQQSQPSSTSSTPDKRDVKQMLLGSLAKSYALFLRAKAKIEENHRAVKNSSKSVGNMLIGLWRVDKGTKLGPAATARFELSAIEYGAVDFYNVVISGLKHCLVDGSCKSTSLPKDESFENTKGYLVSTKHLERKQGSVSVSKAVDAFDSFLKCRREIETDVGAGVFDSSIKAHFKVFKEQNGCGLDEITHMQDMRGLGYALDAVVGSAAGFTALVAGYEAYGFLSTYAAITFNPAYFSLVFGTNQFATPLAAFGVNQGYTIWYGAGGSHGGSAVALGIHNAVLGKVALGLSAVGIANPVGLTIAASVLGAVFVVYAGRRIAIRNIKSKRNARANRITKGLSKQIMRNENGLKEKLKTG